MSDASKGEVKRGKPVRRQRSIYRVHYALPAPAQMARPLRLPAALPVQEYALQVAGHRRDDAADYIGLLQCGDGTILKPILKPSQRREVEFYERVYAATEPALVELRALIPRFLGTTRYTYGGKEMEYIVLEDLTRGMLDQCVMDVKIGRITWDPFASEQKILCERSKYAACREQYAFCIPGYRALDISSHRVLQRGKEFGKQLHGERVVQEIRQFLNGGGGRRLCRALLLRLLAALWRLQRWARAGAPPRLPAASLLLAYDAAGLRACCGGDLRSEAKCRPLPTRRRSVPNGGGGGPLGGQIGSNGPVYRKVSSSALSPPTFDTPPPVTSPWSQALEHLNRSHSFDNNYEENLAGMKTSYRETLDKLTSEGSPEWATVRIIDFAHAYFVDGEPSVDENFREGLDNFVAIFEALLKETDDD